MEIRNRVYLKKYYTKKKTYFYVKIFFSISFNFNNVILLKCVFINYYFYVKIIIYIYLMYIFFIINIKLSLSYVHAYVGY